jgi:hypothetical protein
MSACGRGGGPDRARCHRAQAGRAVLAAAHSRGGLRLRAALAHPAQAARARAEGGRRLAAWPLLGPARQRVAQGPRARNGVRSAGGDRLPPPGRRLAAAAQQEWCGCDTGARIFKSPNGTSSAAGQCPRPCALARRHPHRGNCLKGGRHRPEDLTFIRPAAPRLRGPRRGRCSRSHSERPGRHGA